MQKANILIVEDEELSSISLQKSLTKYGYNIAGICDSGEKAIEFVNNNCIDLIIMDICLNGQFDGIQTANLILKNHNISIVYLTSMDSDEIINRAKLSKPYSYLIKPFQEKELIANIEISLYELEFQKKLIISEQKYRTQFEESQISQWEINLSNFIPLIEKYKTLSEDEFNIHLIQLYNKHEIYNNLIVIKNLNRISLALFESESKEYLINNLHKIFHKTIIDVIKKITYKFAQQEFIFEIETNIKTLKNNNIIIIWKFVVPQANQSDFYSVFMSGIDITAIRESQKQQTLINENLELIVNTRTKELKEINDKLIQEIKNRELVQESLIESDKKYKFIVENIQDGVFVIDGNEFVFVNDALCKMLGYTKEELTGSDYRKSVAPEDLDIITERYHKRLNSKNVPDEYDFNMLHKDGITRIKTNRKGILLNYQDKQIIIGRVTDLTDRLKAEEELVKMNEQLEQKVKERTKGFLTANKMLMDEIKVRRKTEDSLILSEARHRVVSKMISDYVFYVSIDSNQEFVLEWESGSYKKILAMNDIDYRIDFNDINTLIFPEDRKKYDEIIPIVLTNNTVINELRIFALNNNIKWIRYYINPIWESEENRVIGFYGAIQDINEQIRKEEEIKYQAYLLDNISNAIVATNNDENKTITAWNKAAERIYGWSKDEAIGQSSLNIMKIIEYNKSDISLFDKIYNDDYFSSEVIQLSKSNKYLYIEANIITLKNYKNEVSGWVAVLRNVTDRRKAENALKISEKRFKDLADLLPESIFEMDLSGKLMYVNDYAMNKFGYNKEDFAKGITIWDTFPEKYYDTIKEVFQARIKGTNYPRIEYLSKKKDDSTFPSIIHTNLIYDNGKPVGIRGVLIDISELKEKENSLIESERKLVSLISNMSGIVYRCLNDEKWTMLFVSGAVQEITGYNTEIFLSNNFSFNDIIYPEDQKYVWNEIQNAIKENEKYTFSYRIITQNHQIKWILEKGGGVFDNQENLVFIEGVLTDITDLKNSEIALRTSEEKYRNITNNAPIGILLSDIDGNIIEINQKLLDILGSPSIDISRNINVLMDNRMIEVGLADDIMKCINEKIVIQKEIPYISVWNKKLYLRLIISPIININQEVSHVLTIIEDITERINAFIALMESEERYRKLFESSSEGIALFSLEGKFIETNKALEQMLNYSQEELKQISFVDITSDKYKEFNLQQFNSIISDGKSLNYEKEYISKDNRIIPVSVAAWLLHNEEGQPYQIGAFIKDVSERKLAEEQLEKSRQKLVQLTGYLESAREEERKRIAATLHDELGHALTGLKIEISLIRDDNPDNEDLKKRSVELIKLVDDAIQNVKRLSSELRPSILDHFGILAAIEWQIEEFQKRTRLTCHLKMNKKELTIDNDKSTAIFRILQESLTNIARHSNATNVDLKINISKNFFNLELKDNGIGITPDNMAKPNSFGIMGIIERVKSFNGNYEIFGENNHGTTMKLSIPI